MRGMVTLKSAVEIERMRASGRIVAEVLAAIGDRIGPHVTTVELDQIAESIIRAHEGELSFYAQILGFEPGDPIPRLAIENLPA